jgi:hypothetical protein
MKSVLARVEVEVDLGTEDELLACETPSTTISTDDLSLDDVVGVDEDVEDSPPNEELPESIEGEDREESSDEDDDEGTLLFREEKEEKIFGWLWSMEDRWEEHFHEDVVDEDEDEDKDEDEEEVSGDKDEDDEGKATTEFVSLLSEGIGEIVVDFVVENKNELPLLTFVELILLLRLFDLILVVEK